MTPQRRTALVSVIAASALIALKLGTGIATGSLGLLSEAVHSATDLVAALLTFVALGVAGRPADLGHQYGHGKAEHLAALAEAAILVVVSLVIAAVAVSHLAGDSESRVDPKWWAIGVVLVVIAIDASRMVVSLRTGRRYGSPALQSNALHFGGDLAGSGAVLAGLLLARAGYPNGDSAAALFVAVLVLVAAGRLIRRNVDVLMDRAPSEAHDAARQAIAELTPDVDLRRLRIRQASGRHFADVVIGVSPGEAVAQGHAAADAVEEAVRRALPESDVVVHVEPREDAALGERALAAALSVGRVREVHNLVLLNVDGGTEVSLHLKLPGELPLEDAHAAAEEVEHAIRSALPEVAAVHTHIEPLAGEGRGQEVEADRAAVERIVREATGVAPRALRFLRTDAGLVAHLTLGLDSAETLAAAHGRASAIEQRIHEALPEIADVIVHTEP